MHAEGSIRAAVGWAVPVLIAWALVAALWNLGGVWQLARGLRPPGPTASTLTGLLLFVIAAGLGVSIRRGWPRMFALLAVFAGLAALSRMVGAYEQDPSLS